VFCSGRRKPKWQENPPPLKACRFDSDLGHHQATRSSLSGMFAHALCLNDLHSLILKALAVKPVRAARSDLAARSVPAMAPAPMTPMAQSNQETWSISVDDQGRQPPCEHDDKQQGYDVHARILETLRVSSAWEDALTRQADSVPQPTQRRPRESGLIRRLSRAGDHGRIAGRRS
jgi:hypothetical protein